VYHESFDVRLAVLPKKLINDFNRPFPRRTSVRNSARSRRILSLSSATCFEICSIFLKMRERRQNRTAPKNMESKTAMVVTKKKTSILRKSPIYLFSNTLTWLCPCGILSTLSARESQKWWTRTGHWQDLAHMLSLLNQYSADPGNQGSNSPRLPAGKRFS